MTVTADTLPTSNLAHDDDGEEEFDLDGAGGPVDNDAPVLDTQAEPEPDPTPRPRTRKRRGIPVTMTISGTASTGDSAMAPTVTVPSHITLPPNTLQAGAAIELPAAAPARGRARTSPATAVHEPTAKELQALGWLVVQARKQGIAPE